MAMFFLVGMFAGLAGAALSISMFASPFATIKQVPSLQFNAT
jgi:hypothetical protein